MKLAFVVALSAGLAWLGALAVTALSAWLAAREIGFAGPVGWLLAGLLLAAAGVLLHFLRQPETPRAKLIETMSGVWTILMYLSVGAVPLLWQLIT